MTIPIAEGAAKHVVKSGAKHAAKKKVLHKKEIAAQAKKTVSDSVTKGKDKAKSTGKKAVKSFSNSKLSPKFMPAPVSYNVRKQHNILIGMWFATTAIYAFSYYNNEAAIKANPSVQPITTSTFWKRFIAIQFVFFLLSIAVLFDVIAPAVGLFSILVFLGVLFTNGTAVLEGFKAIASGITPPIGTQGGFKGSSGDFNNPSSAQDSGSNSIANPTNPNSGTIYNV